MKGNEARVVFFLHPVNQFKDGEVAKVKKSLWSFFGFRSVLLLIGLLLGLGVLAYVLMAQTGGSAPVVSTTTASITTATTRTTSVTLTSTPTTTTASEPGEPQLRPGNSSGTIADSSPGTQMQRKQIQTEIFSS